MPAPVPLRPPAQPRTPERDHLAAAIASREETSGLLLRIRDAREAQWPRLAAAEQSLSEAEKALREQREDQPRQLAAVALGEATHTGLATAQDLYDARRRELDQAQLLSRALGEREQIAEDDLRAANDAIKQAITTVLVTDPSTLALVTEMTAVKNRMAILTTIAELLPLQAIPDEANFSVNRFDDARLSWLDAESTPWSKAIVALQDDPDATLPG
jgi:hypothetical protein